jgi:hypothetical protein
MDESGDLGFDFSKKKTTRFFVITLLFTNSHRPVEKIVRKTFSSLPEKVKKSHSGVLHASKEKSVIRKRLLTLLNDKDISIISICLNKSKVYTKLQDEKHVLYNYVTNILLDRVYTKKLIPLDSPITLIASKRETNKFLNQNFKNYLESQVNDIRQVEIKINIKTPYQEKSLQAVDFVSWSIFRNLEHNDNKYYDIIKSKIIEDSWLFP